MVLARYFILALIVYGVQASEPNFLDLEGIALNDIGALPPFTNYWIAVDSDFYSVGDGVWFTTSSCDSSTQSTSSITVESTLVIEYDISTLASGEPVLACQLQANSNTILPYLMVWTVSNEVPYLVSNSMQAVTSHVGLVKGSSFQQLAVSNTDLTYGLVLTSESCTNMNGSPSGTISGPLAATFGELDVDLVASMDSNVFRVCTTGEVQIPTGQYVVVQSHILGANANGYSKTSFFPSSHVTVNSHSQSGSSEFFVDTNELSLSIAFVGWEQPCAAAVSDYMPSVVKYTMTNGAATIDLSSMGEDFQLKLCVDTLETGISVATYNRIHSLAVGDKPGSTLVTKGDARGTVTFSVDSVVEGWGWSFVPLGGSCLDEGTYSGTASTIDESGNVKEVLGTYEDILTSETILFLCYNTSPTGLVMIVRGFYLLFEVDGHLEQTEIEVLNSSLLTFSLQVVNADDAPVIGTGDVLKWIDSSGTDCSGVGALEVGHSSEEATRTWSIPDLDISSVVGGNYRMCLFSNEAQLWTETGLSVTTREGTAAVPTFDVTSGVAPFDVNLACSDSNCYVAYTVDGSTPSCDSNDGNPATVTVVETISVQAIACKQHYFSSQVVSQNLTASEPGPTIPSWWTSKEPVILTENVNAELPSTYYTTDGTVPQCEEVDNLLLLDSDPLVLSTTTTVSAITCIASGSETIPSALSVVEIVIDPTITSIQPLSAPVNAAASFTVGGLIVWDTEYKFLAEGIACENSDSAEALSSGIIRPDFGGEDSEDDSVTFETTFTSVAGPFPVNAVLCARVTSDTRGTSDWYQVGASNIALGEINVESIEVTNDIASFTDAPISVSGQFLNARMPFGVVAASLDCFDTSLSWRETATVSSDGTQLDTHVSFLEAGTYKICWTIDDGLERSEIGEFTVADPVVEATKNVVVSTLDTELVFSGKYLASDVTFVAIDELEVSSCAELEETSFPSRSADVTEDRTEIAFSVSGGPLEDGIYELCFFRSSSGIIQSFSVSATVGTAIVSSFEPPTLNPLLSSQSFTVYGSFLSNNLMMYVYDVVAAEAAAATESGANGGRRNLGAVQGVEMRSSFDNPEWILSNSLRSLSENRRLQETAIPCTDAQIDAGMGASIELKDTNADSATLSIGVGAFAGVSEIGACWFTSVESSFLVGDTLSTSIAVAEPSFDAISPKTVPEFSVDAIITAFGTDIAGPMEVGFAKSGSFCSDIGDGSSTTLLNLVEETSATEATLSLPPLEAGIYSFCSKDASSGTFTSVGWNPEAFITIQATEVHSVNATTFIADSSTGIQVTGVALTSSIKVFFAEDGACHSAVGSEVVVDFVNADASIAIASVVAPIVPGEYHLCLKKYDNVTTSANSVCVSEEEVTTTSTPKILVTSSSPSFVSALDNSFGWLRQTSVLDIPELTFSLALAPSSDVELYVFVQLADGTSINVGSLFWSKCSWQSQQSVDFSFISSIISFESSIDGSAASSDVSTSSYSIAITVAEAFSNDFDIASVGSEEDLALVEILGYPNEREFEIPEVVGDGPPLVAVIVDGTVKEGAEDGRISVRGAEEPSDALVIDIRALDERLTSDLASIELNPSNWLDPQVVTISGQSDNIVSAPYTAEIQFTNGDLAQIISVSVADGDVASATFSQLSGDTVSELGSEISFEVALTVIPTSPVDVVITSEDPTEGLLRTNTLVHSEFVDSSISFESEIGANGLLRRRTQSDHGEHEDEGYDSSEVAETVVLTFTPDAWDIPQTVWVRGVRDTDNTDGLVPFDVSLSHYITSDPHYSTSEEDRPSLRLYNSPAVYPVVSHISTDTCPMLGCNITISGAGISPSSSVHVGEEQVQFEEVGTNSTWTLLDINGYYNAIHFEAPQRAKEGYASLVITNPDGSTVEIDDFLYYTEECPDPTMWGSGLLCTQCPSGAQCPGGSRIWPQVGFWIHSEEAEPGDLVACSDPPERCLGSRFSLCKRGYEGQFCDECEDDYYRKGTICLPCKVESEDEAEGRALLSMALLFVLFMALSAVIFPLEVFDLMAWAFQQLQMLATIGLMAKADLPKDLQDYYSILSLILLDFQFIRPGCAIGKFSFTSVWAATFFLSVLLPVPAFLGFEFKRWLYRKIGRKLQKRNFSANTVTRVYFTLLTFGYSILLTRTLQSLVCVEKEGNQHLVVELATVCWQGAHMAVAFFAFIIALAGGLLIALLFFVSRRHRTKLAEDELTNRRFNFLYGDYVEDRYEFMALDFLVDYIMSFSVAVLPNDIIGQSTLVLLTLSAHVVLVLLFRPFVSKPLLFLFLTKNAIGAVGVATNAVSADEDTAEALSNFFYVVTAIHLTLLTMFVVQQLKEILEMIRKREEEEQRRESSVSNFSRADMGGIDGLGRVKDTPDSDAESVHSRASRVSWLGGSPARPRKQMQRGPSLRIPYHDRDGDGGGQGDGGRHDPPALSDDNQDDQQQQPQQLMDTRSWFERFIDSVVEYFTEAPEEGSKSSLDLTASPERPFDEPTSPNDRCSPSGSDSDFETEEDNDRRPSFRPSRLSIKNRIRKASSLLKERITSPKSERYEPVEDEAEQNRAGDWSASDASPRHIDEIDMVERSSASEHEQ